MLPPDAAVGKPEPSSWGLLGTKVGEGVVLRQECRFRVRLDVLLPLLSLQRLDKGATHAGDGSIMGAF